MRITQSVIGLVTLVALLLTPLAPLSGPRQIALAQTMDPPGRVGRLSYMSGPVSFAPAGVNEWAPAALNYPLTTGAALWTDTQARAEVHIGSTAIRLDQYTELDLLNLDDQTAQLRVPQGTIEVSLFQLAAGEQFEVATPTASVTLVQPGRYRFQVDSSGLQLTIWAGQAEVATSSYVFAISAVQTVLIGASTPGGVAYQVIQTPPFDEFEQWALARHQEEQRALLAASQYASPMMTGLETLAAYGTWRAVGVYGWVWFPRVWVDWAPYRDGRWVWISPWGWTWIDNSPWGFAPFHYGRWIFIGGQWGWLPGPIYVVPVFVPALVVFIVIGDIVGWFPLSPYDVYVPPYRASPHYFQTVNITVININIYNVRTVNAAHLTYVYRDHPKGRTLVRQDQFAGARVIDPGLMAVPPARDVTRARVFAAAPIPPNITSVLGHPREMDAPRPPRIVAQRPVVVRNTPPVVTPPPIPGVQVVPREAPVRRATDARNVVPPMSETRPPQVKPAQQGPPDRPSLPFSCDPRSPIYDPRRCPPPAPQPRTVQPPAPQPRPVPPGAVQGPQRRPGPAGPNGPGTASSCDPRSPIYDPRQCPPPATPRTVQPSASQSPAVRPPQGRQNRPTQPAPTPRGKPFSCDPRSPIYDPRQCPPPPAH